MIHHLSIAARDPKHSAEVLAEIMGGKAVPFPPNPGSFFALQLDDHGSGVEVYPAGTELQPAGEEGGSFVRKPREGRGFGATHFALSVATDAGKVKQIAERAVDVFYVKDMFGLKIVNQDKLKQVADTVEQSIRDFDARFEPVPKAAE